MEAYKYKYIPFCLCFQDVCYLQTWLLNEAHTQKEKADEAGETCWESAQDMRVRAPVMLHLKKGQKLT